MPNERTFVGLLINFASPLPAFGKELNNQIMELMIMAYCCKTSSAKNIGEY